MIFKQFRFEPLGGASYLVGCSRTGEAAVVDPSMDIGADNYILEAADLGLTITQVLDTHVHADYISAARPLAEATDASLRMHPSASETVTFDFVPAEASEVISVGNVRVAPVHTPGHTREHLSFVVTDGARTDEPWFVLTGDSLLVGDVGRPDLVLDEASESLIASRAGQLHDSIGVLMKLPDNVEVYPGHYGGSSCGGMNLSGKAVSTIGFERRHNQALQTGSREAFVSFVMKTLRPLPDDYRTIKAINAGMAMASGEVRR